MKCILTLCHDYTLTFSEFGQNHLSIEASVAHHNIIGVAVS